MREKPLFLDVLKSWGQLLHSHNKSINKIPARPTQRLLTTSKCLPVKLHCGGLILLLLCDGLHHSWELKVINTYKYASRSNLQIAWQHFESSVANGNQCTALICSLVRTQWVLWIRTNSDKVELKFSAKTKTPIVPYNGSELWNCSLTFLSEFHYTVVSDFRSGRSQLIWIFRA